MYYGVGCELKKNLGPSVCPQAIISNVGWGRPLIYPRQVSEVCVSPGVAFESWQIFHERISSWE